MKILITGACAVSARSVLRSLKLSPLFSDSEFIGWDMCNLLYGVYSGEFDRMYRVPAHHFSDIGKRSSCTDRLRNGRKRREAVNNMLPSSGEPFPAHVPSTFAHA